MGGAPLATSHLALRITQGGQCWWEIGENISMKRLGCQARWGMSFSNNNNNNMYICIMYIYIYLHIVYSYTHDMHTHHICIYILEIVLVLFCFVGNERRASICVNHNIQPSLPSFNFGYVPVSTLPYLQWGGSAVVRLDIHGWSAVSALQKGLNHDPNSLDAIKQVKTLHLRATTVCLDNCFSNWEQQVKLWTVPEYV